MPKVRVTKKQQVQEEPEEVSQELIEERLEALQLKFREKTMADFLAENAGAKLEKVIAYCNEEDKFNNQLDVAANVLDKATNLYIETGKLMDDVLAAQKSIEVIQEKCNSMGSVPTGCNELYKLYRKAQNPKMYGQR
jgi:hypothetical protein